LLLLRDWWNMKSWVRAKGLSLSGDNDAFGHLVRQRLGIEDGDHWTAETVTAAAQVHPHIRMPSRCRLNSFGVFVTDPGLAVGGGGTKQPFDNDKNKKPEWYLSDQFYHDGDFIAHASGIDQKGVGVEFLLKRAT